MSIAFAGYSNALTSAEIDTLYNAGIAVDWSIIPLSIQDKFKSYYNLCDNGGSEFPISNRVLDNAGSEDLDENGGINKEFKDLKTKLGKNLATSSKDLDQENEILWREICNFQFIFERPAASQVVLDYITMKDLSGHFLNTFTTPTAKRLELAYVSQKHNNER